MLEYQTIPLEATPVVMVSDGGTVYDVKGNDVGIALKGTHWFTRYLEWTPRGGEDSVVVGLEDVDGNWTWAFPTEISQQPGYRGMKRKRWRYRG